MTLIDGQTSSGWQYPSRMAYATDATPIWHSLEPSSEDEFFHRKNYLFYDGHVETLSEDRDGEPKGITWNQDEE
jgi:prepilin-type processing-associated H-X9-DG protein